MAVSPGAGQGPVGGDHAGPGAGERGRGRRPVRGAVGQQPADRAARVRAQQAGRDLRAVQQRPPLADPPREAVAGDRERRLHRAARRPVPHVRGPRQHGRPAPPLRHLQEHLPAQQDAALRGDVRRRHHLRRRRRARARPVGGAADKTPRVPAHDGALPRGDRDDQHGPGAEDPPDVPRAVHPGRDTADAVRLRGEHALNAYLFYIL